MHYLSGRQCTIAVALTLVTVSFSGVEPKTLRARPFAHDSQGGSPMTLRASRRHAMQAALVPAAAATMPGSRAAAKSATPAASANATITAAQVQTAVNRLNAL